MLHIYRHVTGLREFRPVVLTQKTEGDWMAETVEVIPRSSFRFLGRFFEKRTGRPWQISPGEVQAFCASLDRHDCELLHVFFGNVAVHMLPLFRKLKIPFVVSFHGSDVAGSMASPEYTETLAEIFDRAAFVPCRSEQLARAVHKLGCPQDKLRIMRTIVPEFAGIVRPHPPSDGTWRLVQAARLVRKKGIPTTLRAFAEFTLAHPFSTLTIAGEGPLENELRALASELNIEDRVEFAGFLDQESLHGLFAGSHFFLQPSETAGGDVEGVPNAMLEAMAIGLPVFATRHGGIPEVVTEGREGLLVEEGDHAGLAQAMLRVAGDPALFEELSRHASQTIHERFSPARQVAAIEAMYREVIATP